MGTPSQVAAEGNEIGLGCRKSLYCMLVHVVAMVFAHLIKIDGRFKLGNDRCNNVFEFKQDVFCVFAANKLAKLAENTLV